MARVRMTSLIIVELLARFGWARAVLPIGCGLCNPFSRLNRAASGYTDAVRGETAGSQAVTPIAGHHHSDSYPPDLCMLPYHRKMTASAKS
jgi:hypothetical protein